MHINKVTGLLVLLCSELCLTIKVPISWDESGNSAVKNEPNDQVEIVKPQNVQTLHQSQQIPIEYFQYTAQKPQFAADIAAFHGVQNPQQHYKAYPVKPYTNKDKPVLGIHQILNDDRTIYQPYQKYVQKTAEIKNHVHPTSTGYEVFHPYKAEVPALQEIYKDPILSKIRNDLQDSQNRLQAYEKQAGEPNVADDEYLEGQQKTDSKLFPQKNIPARYEIHRPERRPVYYRAPLRDTHRDHVLNQRLRHPWNQHNAKIRPVHYKPLKNHIHNLRQQHAMKYDDERNEYPQVILAENIAEPQDGYDIYEKGKQTYTKLRNNIDENLNKAVQQNRPAVFQKLELQKNEPKPVDEEQEFIPIKNYAQVRKTETFKHVPKKAAFDDAETYEEILNAPRLREAVKSTKAQTVYSEEGYEDSAYDHAGEQKHASEQEGHGGFLKEHEKSAGLYKIPTVLGSYQDGRGSEYRDNIEHGEKWKNNNKDDEEETESEKYSEDEHDELVDADIYNDKDPEIGNRNKREGEADTDNIDSEDADAEGIDIEDFTNDKTAQDRMESDSTINHEINNTNAQHEVDKREVDFKIPEISLNSTYLTEGETPKLAKQKISMQKNNNNIKEKYPYYFKKLKAVNENSPLRYAENLKFIPKKSGGGTEFYDSRSILECPEVDEDVDPLPEKLKNGEDPTEEDEENESNTKGDKKFDISKKQQRLKGLGDKIDCFKAKYFGENPLDSPFFKEEIILNPKPITAPKLPIYKQLKNTKKENAQESKINNVIDLSEKLKNTAKTDIFALLDKLRTDQNRLQDSLNEQNEDLKTVLYTPLGTLATNDTQQSNVYTDILTNIKNDLKHPVRNLNMSASLLDSNKDDTNVTYNFFQNKEDVTKLPPKYRRKRATPFVYEPYKIIRDSQVQDSKKTTTTSNISPLIRQLQSSRVVDRVSRSNRDDRQVKPNTSSRTYVDIGKKERTKSNINPTIVDVSVDQRRGEPRYEIRPANHKSGYIPVENKRAMSVEDYKTRATTEQTNDSTAKSTTPIRGRQRFRQTTTVRPHYDVSSFLPKVPDVQNVASSNAVKNTVTTTTPATVSKEIEELKEDLEDDSDESDEEYDDDENEEEDEEEEEEKLTTTTTTTTPKPSFRRRMRISTTTDKPQHNNADEPERLRLVTRFRNYKPSENYEEMEKVTEPPLIKKYKEEDDVMMPKYREKKKKTSKSTLVTDTKKYGNDDDDEEDDIRKEEVDAMIGVKQNMDDYMPLYEKEEERKRHQSSRDRDEDDDDEEEDDDDDGDDEDDDEDDDYDDENYTNVEEDEDEAEEETKKELEITTPEPTKRTLVQTTDAPLPTVASHVRKPPTFAPSRIINPENKPIVTRKKIEIHTELPVNKSSPHVTQFKQDIKEVEIIREIPGTPKRKPHKKVEPLELYKDDSLAKDVNKLGDVEIFSDGIDLDKGPKHGGNYRKATKEDLRLLKPQSQESITKPPKDTETSQSENKKHVEIDDYVPQRLHVGNLKSLSDVKRTRNTGRSAKLVELTEAPVRPALHGGNLRYNNKRRGGRRNEKLIELDDDRRHDDRSSQDDDYKSSSHNSRNDRLHGGNYRSAKLVVEKDKEGDDIRVKNPSREARRNSAALLSSFVQAVPVLTTTPGYIVDPSKRMYYYVEA